MDGHKFLPFTIIIDLMGHFEEDISTKPALHVFAPGSFTLIEITKPIFPNKNPGKENPLQNSKADQNETWAIIILMEYQFLLFPLQRSRAPPP